MQQDKSENILKLQIARLIKIYCVDMTELKQQVLIDCFKHLLETYDTITQNEKANEDVFIKNCMQDIAQFNIHAINININDICKYVEKPDIEKTDIEYEKEKQDKIKKFINSFNNKESLFFKPFNNDLLKGLLNSLEERTPSNDKIEIQHICCIVA